MTPTECEDMKYGKKGTHTHIYIAPGSKQTALKFSYPFVLHSYTTPQSVVYDKYVASLVQSACRGWNATVFAYGCTSSGKSYTMQGVPGDEGIIPRALEDVFRHVDSILQSGSSDMVFSAHISFVELYNGKFRQLLEDKDRKGSKNRCCSSKLENGDIEVKIEVRESKNGDAYLIGGTNLRRPVTNLQEVIYNAIALLYQQISNKNDINKLP